MIIVLQYLLQYQMMELVLILMWGANLQDNSEINLSLF